MSAGTVWHTAARHMAPAAHAACMSMVATLLVYTHAQATPLAPLANTPTATVAPDTNPLCGPTAQSQPLDQLLQHISACQNQPDWLTHLGQRLLDQGRYPEAADHLERALLLAPQHAGAALAYSIALAGLGDLPSGLQLLTQLTRRADLPATDRQALLAAQIRMAEAPLPQIVNTPTGWVQRHSAGLRVGYDNNLMGAPRLSNLTLTLPGGDTTLPLDAASQPRPGSYQRADLRLEATHTQAGGRRIDVALGLQHRHSPALPSASTSQLEWALDTQPAQHNSGPWANLGQSSLHTQGGTRYHTSGLAAGWAWAASGACQPRLGLDWQNRRLASNPVLSGDYKGGVASMGCNLPTATGQNAWLPASLHLSARFGADQPRQATRPGGTQHTGALRATLRWPLWVAEAELHHTQDTVGYSPILDNNRIRHTTRGLLRLERFVPLQHLSTGLYATIGLELYSQHANLALFKINSTSVYASLRKQW